MPDNEKDESPAAATPGHMESVLYQAAVEEARKALTSYAATDTRALREASMAVGLAAEYLVGSALARIDPVLLGEATSAASMVLLARPHSLPGMLDPKTLRTASVTQKRERLEFAYPQLSIKADLAHLLSVRNGAAHVALVSPGHLPAAVVTLVRVVDALHTVLPHRDLSLFWGVRLRAVVEELRDVRSSVVRQRVAAKVAAAQGQLLILTAGLDPQDRERILAAWERRGSDIQTNAEVRVWTCPACDRQGRLSYFKDRSDDPVVETLYDDDGLPEAQLVIFSVAGLPVSFSCPVCDLNLSGEELAIYPPMDEVIELDDESEDAGDYFRDWEPDEDYLRGR